jgi:hypothetical protein
MYHFIHLFNFQENKHRIDAEMGFPKSCHRFSVFSVLLNGTLSQGYFLKFKYPFEKRRKKALFPKKWFLRSVTAGSLFSKRGSRKFSKIAFALPSTFKRQPNFELKKV